MTKFNSCGWNETWVSLLCRPITGLSSQRRMIDKYGAIGGIRIDRGNRSTRWKPSPVPLCLPHDLTCGRTDDATVGSQQLTARSIGVPEKLFPLRISVRCSTNYFFDCMFQICSFRKCVDGRDIRGLQISSQMFASRTPQNVHKPITGLFVV
jgi:hypothetical protein